MSYENTMNMLRDQTMLKVGATSTEAVKIQAMLEKGMTPLEISNELQIQLACVESFCPTVPVLTGKDPGPAPEPEPADPFADMRKNSVKRK